MFLVNKSDIPTVTILNSSTKTFKIVCSIDSLLDQSFHGLKTILSRERYGFERVNVEYIN